MTSRTEHSLQRVLYNGWALAREPDGPEALHLLTMLELHPPEFQAMVALPGSIIHPLPGGVEILQQPAADTAFTRLHWEQRILPRMAVERAARLLHQTAGSAPLWGKSPCLISPAVFSQHGLFEERAGPRPGWIESLRQAAGWGGLSHSGTLCWPEDLPTPELETPTRLLPGVVHPLFQPAEDDAGDAQERFRLLSGAVLPETYILYHGPAGEADLERLFNAWSWAAGPVGEYYPLILAGSAGRFAHDLIEKHGLAESVRVLPELQVAALAAVYQGCSLLFHPAQMSAWGDPVRLALACGKPVVALDTPRCAALVGPAAYLAPNSDGGRALGAALLSVVVEESLSASLGEAALKRAASWDSRQYTAALGNTYRALI